MNNLTIDKVLTILQKSAPSWNVPIVTQIAKRSKDPFRILISTMLSLRTKDAVTSKASERLFKRAHTPELMISLSVWEIENLIYPVGFYKRKAQNIRLASQILIDKYGGEVPDDLNELLKLPGVGRKTANLVITLGFGKKGICVDTHVHRICNRFGYVRTKSPDDTEMALREKLPEKWWIAINDILVAFGQSLCKPTSPMCSRCPVEEFCAKKGVSKHR